MASIEFLGAAGTVTGSKYLVATSRARVLVDCGLFQGLKDLRLRNWDKPHFDPRSIDAIVLTHAHIDHAGYIPRLVRQGFEGPIYATPPTIDLCGILLPDSGHLQEEEAEHANRRGYSKHSPALPLYTAEDAVNSLRHLKPIPYSHVTQVAKGIRVRMSDAGHILGSAIVEMWVSEGELETKLVFSGDLGRYGEPLLADPSLIEEAQYLIMESTYGDRLHSNGHPELQLVDAVTGAVESGGALVIPSFAVGRTQQLLFAFHSLLEERKIPDLPVYVDSPMATDATKIFLAHPEAHRIDLRRLENDGENPLRLPRLSYVQNIQDSLALDGRKGSMIVISASGMATGGRILHHLEAFLPDSRATVLFVGYQAAGTRGRSLLDGAKELKMHGEMVPVRASIKKIDGFSAHADRDELLRWLSGFRKAPARTFLVHGEGEALSSLAESIRSRFGWKTEIAALGELAHLR